MDDPEKKKKKLSLVIIYFQLKRAAIIQANCGL